MKALIKKYSGEFFRFIGDPVAHKNKTLIRTQLSAAHIQQNLEFGKKIKEVKLMMGIYRLYTVVR